MASLFYASQAQGVQRIAVGCGSSPAPRLCSIKLAAHRTNTWRHALARPAIPIEQRVYSEPGRRGYYLWLWDRRRDRTHRIIRGLNAWYWSSGASCVHGREGSWWDPNSPYYGGFQMSLSFQQSHGWRFYERFGTADHWPVIGQIQVTRRVVTASGWGQWPNTAAACGLL